jgi:hypothetical protein
LPGCNCCCLLRLHCGSVHRHYSVRSVGR